MATAPRPAMRLAARSDDEDVHKGPQCKREGDGKTTPLRGYTVPLISTERGIHMMQSSSEGDIVEPKVGDTSLEVVKYTRAPRSRLRTTYLKSLPHTHKIFLHHGIT
eukprot:scaffold6156_cov23-Cyclotella_meneghiniana.AAC.2